MNKVESSSREAANRGPLEEVPDNNPPLPLRCHSDENGGRNGESIIKASPTTNLNTNPERQNGKQVDEIKPPLRVATRGSLEAVLPGDDPPLPPQWNSCEIEDRDVLGKTLIAPQTIFNADTETTRPTIANEAVSMRLESCDGSVEDNSHENPVLDTEDPVITNADCDQEDSAVATAELTTHTADTQEAFEVPHAFLVEEDSEAEEEEQGRRPVRITVIAEPLLPWWKQKRVKHIAVAVLILIIVLTAIIAVMLFSPASSVRSTSIGGMSSTSPSASPTPIKPTLSPSLLPSSSHMPSLSPVSCAQQMLENAQDFGLDAFVVDMDVDGNHAVVATNDYLLFYSWIDDRWRRTDRFANVCESTRHSTVAISNRVAVIGCPFDNAIAGDLAGRIYIFENENSTGFWQQHQGPIVPDDGGYVLGYFGDSVDVDGDIIVVGSPFPGPGQAYVFHRGETMWHQIEKLTSPQFCFESFSFFEYGLNVAAEGNTIAVSSSCKEGSILIYEYSPNSDNLVFLRNQLIVSRFDVNDPFKLSGDHIGHFSKGWGLDIFRSQPDIDRPFILLQHFNVTNSSDDTKLAFDINSGMLAFAEQLSNPSEYTRVYVLTVGEDGSWGESVVLDLPNFNVQTIAISDHHLVMSSLEEIKSFGLDGCVLSLSNST